MSCISKIGAIIKSYSLIIITIKVIKESIPSLRSILKAPFAVLTVVIIILSFIIYKPIGLSFIMEDNDKFDLYVKSQAATSNYNGSYALTTKNGYTLSCGVKDGYYVKIACLSKEIGESNKLELKTYQNDTIISFMESNIILSYTEECLNEKQIVMVTDNKLLDTQKWTLQIVDDDKTYIKQGDYYLSYNEETMEVYTAPYNDAIIQVWNITPYTVN